jgi:hypothetical protein
MCLVPTWLHRRVLISVQVWKSKQQQPFSDPRRQSYGDYRMHRRPPVPLSCQLLGVSPCQRGARSRAREFPAVPLVTAFDAVQQTEICRGHDIPKRLPSGQWCGMIVFSGKSIHGQSQNCNCRLLSCRWIYSGGRVSLTIENTGRRQRGVCSRSEVRCDLLWLEQSFSQSFTFGTRITTTDNCLLG